MDIITIVLHCVHSRPDIHQTDIYGTHMNWIDNVTIFSLYLFVHIYLGMLIYMYVCQHCKKVMVIPFDRSTFYVILSLIPVIIIVYIYTNIFMYLLVHSYIWLCYTYCVKLMHEICSTACHVWAVTYNNRIYSSWNRKEK